MRKKLEMRSVMRGRQKGVKTERSVSGHGAAPLPKVKGKLSWGKINKEGKERRNQDIHPGEYCTQIKQATG